MFVNIFRKQIYFIVQLFMNLIIISYQSLVWLSSQKGEKDKTTLL